MKNLGPIISFILFLSFIASINYFLGHSFASFFGLGSSWLLSLGFVAINFFMIFGVIGLINATSRKGNFVFAVAAVTMGFYLYLLLSTILVNVLSLFLTLEPHYFGITALTLASLVSIYGIWNATNTKVIEVDVSIKGLHKPFRAAHLTDTHLGHFRGGKKLQQIVEMINQQKVAVVFITGDLLDGRINLKAESMAPLKNIEAPVYFVVGNHDEHTGAAPIKKYLKSIGINVLENEVKEWGDLQIIGLDHLIADDRSTSPHIRPNGLTIQKALAELPIKKERPSLLLHHSPDGIQYANAAGIDLYLTGHTHAGQMWPATYIAKRMFTYNKGLHNFKGTQIYVSQGTGTFGPPMRVGTDSELTILNIS